MNQKLNENRGCIVYDLDSHYTKVTGQHILVVVVLRSPIHANEPSEYNGMLYRTSNRVLNNGIKVIILICMDGTSQYHHYPYFRGSMATHINMKRCFDYK